MAARGRLFGAKYGQDLGVTEGILVATLTNYAMASLNIGYSGRFKATSAKDIYSVKLRWGTVTAAGQVTIRIETDSSGKPSGSLYDANAVMTAQVPVANSTQTYTFSTPPSTGLTIDAMYHIVILTTTGGTTMNLRIGPTSSCSAEYPLNGLTAADGTTRTNFAEVTNALPLCSLLLEDGSEDSMGMLPGADATNSITLNTTAGAVPVVGLKFVTDVTLVLAGIEFGITKNGTPTADLRIRIYDSTDTLVTNSTIVLPLAGIITGAGSHRSQAFGFANGSTITLTPGTYRVVFDGAADTSSANCWRLVGYTMINAASAPSGFAMTTAPDISSPVWVDTQTNLVPVGLILDDVLSPGGGGSAGMLYMPNLSGT